VVCILSGVASADMVWHCSVKLLAGCGAGGGVLFTFYWVTPSLGSLSGRVASGFGVGLQ
jgi:hypothetical protein